MIQKVELYVPKLEELWFYQKMLSDPEAMSYNANSTTPQKRIGGI